MTTTAPVHPWRADACVRAAEWHEFAAAVLRRRRPESARAHAEAAAGLRAMATQTTTAGVQR